MSSKETEPLNFVRELDTGLSQVCCMLPWQSADPFRAMFVRPN